MMTQRQPSAQMKNYLNKVQAETGRPINIEYAPNMGMHGMKAGFRVTPTDIRIVLLPGMNPTDPAVEQSIAHEVTHGLLMYKYGYQDPRFRRPPTKGEQFSVYLVINAIEDMVVNKLIQQEGFRPFGPVYIPEARRETVAAQQQQPYYQQVSPDPVLRERFIVYRYLLAWGSLEYLSLSATERSTLEGFIQAVPNAYPGPYADAAKMSTIIKTHDIFDVAGYKQAVQEALAVWNLATLVQM